MAQYVPFAEGVEVNGTTILSFVKAIPVYSGKMVEILSSHGIRNLVPDHWYSQECWLRAFKEIDVSYGPNTLFAIGKAIPENALFPPHISNLKDALHSIDIAYHLNHRNGEIGHYTLTHYDADNCMAIMACNNPYPSHFDRGIIMSIARKFKPADALIVQVTLDEGKGSRLQGGDTCYYNITW